MVASNTSGFVPKINLAAAALLGPKPLARLPLVVVTSAQLATLVSSPKALDAHLATCSYVEGSQPSMKDVSVFKAICPVPTLPHAARWYRHMAPIVAKMHEVDALSVKLCTLPGVYENLIPGADGGGKGGAAGGGKGGASGAKSAPSSAPPSAPKGGDAGAEEENSATQQEVLALLLQKIPNRFKASTHEAVRTSEEAAAVRGATLASGAKAMLLSVKGASSANEFVLVVISAAAKMDSKAFKKLGAFKSTRFASEEEVRTVTGCLPGAVPPFGSVWGLRTFMDESLQTQGDMINFNAGLRTFSVSMSVADYLAVEGPTVCSIR